MLNPAKPLPKQVDFTLSWAPSALPCHCLTRMELGFESGAQALHVKLLNMRHEAQQGLAERHLKRHVLT